MLNLFGLFRGNISPEILSISPLLSFFVSLCLFLRLPAAGPLKVFLCHTAARSEVRERQILAFTHPVNCSILHRCYYSSLPLFLNFLLSPISSHHCHFWTFSYLVLIPMSLSFLHSDHQQLMFRLSDTFCLAISFLRLDHPPCFDFQLLSAKSDTLSSVRSSGMHFSTFN